MKHLKKKDLLIEIEKLQSKVAALEKRVRTLELNNISTVPANLQTGGEAFNHPPVFADVEPTTPTVICGCESCNRPPGAPDDGPTKRWL